MIANHPLMRRGRGNLMPSMVVAFIKGVKYLDKMARKPYELEINGSISKSGIPFGTESMRTVHSGQGFAIWVAGGKDSKFFAGNHVKGQFHHSSFLEGGDVVCGGEMVVRGGQLKLLTAKTGHYQADMDHFVRAIRLPTASGISPDSYRVMVWDRYDYSAPVIPCPLAQDILANPDGFITWGNGTLPMDAWDV
jgi:hypothetical protein